MNKYPVYSIHTKLADIIAVDHELLTILERLNISLGFGDAEIGEVCKKYDISPNLFLMICNIYSFENYLPDISRLTRNDIMKIVNYLISSHTYYTGTFFPKLHDNIHRMVEDYDAANHDVINKFYDIYDAEVNHHFNYEESVVFPYIHNLINGNSTAKSSYSINRFEENHTNIEEKLKDLRNIIIKYIPESNSNAARFEAVMNIFRIERDLKKHAMVENKLLIPLVSKLEHDD